MPELEHEACRIVKGAFVVHVEEGVIQIETGGSSVHDEGQGQGLRHRDPRILLTHIGEIVAIDAAARDEPADCLFLFLSPGRHDDEMEIVDDRRLGEPALEFGEVHVRAMVGRNRHDQPDGSRLAGCQTLCRPVRTIAGVLGSLEHALACLLVDFRVAIECAADCRLRQAEHL